MCRHITGCVLAFGVIVLVGCGGEGQEGGPDTSGDSQQPDAIIPDAGTDLLVDDGTDATSLEDLIVDAPDSKGMPDHGCGGGCCGGSPWWGGCPCTDNSECFSFFCIETKDGRVCAEVCYVDSDCGQSWKCVQVATVLGDPIFVCVDPNIRLCFPCLSDDDCLHPYLEDLGHCIDRGSKGSFCTRTCAGNNDCPYEHDCLDGFCWPAGDVDCTCSDKAIALGLETTCYINSQWGTCPGSRRCLESGLTDCDAQVPEAEICNGIDDNCDGETDEGFPKVCLNPDKDNDGILDEEDNCPWTYNPDQKDSDCDSEGDVCDDDYDGDWVPNDVDNCPITYNPTQNNSDVDGAGDACDQDVDNDGVSNPNLHHPDPCSWTSGFFDPNIEDTDSDGTCDACDSDDDGDGIVDTLDNCPRVPNPDQVDSYGNGWGDECGCGGIDDNCPFTSNPDQSDCDGDGIGDACAPYVDDGIPNDIDNCPWIFNPLQEDLDLDDMGDACDCDIDGDSEPNHNPGCSPCCDTYVWFGESSAGGGCLYYQACDGSEGYPQCDPCPYSAGPGAVEICNGYDDNCDDIIDPPDTIGCSEYYLDKDQDGWGSSEKMCLCHTIVPYTATQQGDCDEQDPDVNPAAIEECNGTDDNCDGQTDEGCPPEAP